MRFARACAFVLSAIAATACAKSVSQQTEYMKNIPPSPSLTTTTWQARYKAYPVSAAFGRHAVRLTAAQRRWLLHVMRSSTYKSRIGKLEFALFPGRDTPLIVFVDDGTPGVPDLENYNVIGDCGITFSYDRGVDGHACGLLP